MAPGASWFQAALTPFVAQISSALRMQFVRKPSIPAVAYLQQPMRILKQRPTHPDKISSRSRRRINSSRDGSVGLTGEFIAAYGGESSRPASLDELIRRLDRGEFDLVAVGRALLQDPQWLLKVRDGRTEELMAFERTAFAALN